MASVSVDALERALYARWDNQTLVVLADALQAAGDPRGELIAIDLSLAHGYSHALGEARRRALAAWLGESFHGEPWPERGVRFGFLTSFVVGRQRRTEPGEVVRRLLASPAGRYVQGLTISVADDAAFDEVLTVMGRASWPWLERLEIIVDELTLPTAPALVEQVIAATPRLRRLELWAPDAFETFAHPAVRSLATDVAGLHVLPSLPDVSELDLLIEDPIEEIARDRVAPYLRAPLRHFDLSRNEPLRSQGAIADVYWYALGLPLDALSLVRLPSARTQQHRATLVTLLERFPRLEIEVARLYPGHPLGDSIPRLSVPPPFTWPEPQLRDARLEVTLPDRTSEVLWLSRVCDLLEAQWSELAPACRDAWNQCWRHVLSPRDPLPAFSATTLLVALEPLDDAVANVPGPCRTLAAALQRARLPANALVELRWVVE